MNVFGIGNMVFTQLDLKLVVSLIGKCGDHEYFVPCLRD